MKSRPPWAQVASEWFRWWKKCASSWPNRNEWFYNIRSFTIKWSLKLTVFHSFKWVTYSNIRTISFRWEIFPKSKMCFCFFFLVEFVFKGHVFCLFKTDFFFFLVTDCFHLQQSVHCNQAITTDRKVAENDVREWSVNKKISYSSETLIKTEGNGREEECHSLLRGTADQAKRNQDAFFWETW